MVRIRVKGGVSRDIFLFSRVWERTMKNTIRDHYMTNNFGGIKLQQCSHVWLFVLGLGFPMNSALFGLVIQ